MKLVKYYKIKDLPGVPDQARRILRKLLNDSEGLITVLGLREKLSAVIINGEKVYSVGFGKRTTKVNVYFPPLGPKLKGGQIRYLPRYLFLTYLLVKYEKRKESRFYANLIDSSKSFVVRNEKKILKELPDLVRARKIQVPGKLKDAVTLLSTALDSKPDIKALNKLIRKYRRELN